MRSGMVATTASLFVFSLLPSLAQAVDVPQWSVHTIRLAAKKHYDNPYTETAVTATFTGPDNVVKTVKGFWDGDAAFLVRFNPTVQGTWTYTTSSSDPGLDGKSGSFNCVTPLPGSHGFLRIDADHPYSFVYDDGTHCFLWGQTYYDIIHGALVADAWKTSIDNSAAYGMKKVRMHLYAQQDHWGFESSSKYPDAMPYAGEFTKPNRDRLNLPYWNKLDEIVEYIGAKGMMADIILNNPYRKNRMFGTPAQNNRLMEYVVARYAAYPNVMWTMANEWNWSAKFKGDYPQQKADFNRMGTLIRQSDPWMNEGKFLRPLSIHQMTRIDFEFFDSKWPTHACVQFGTRNGKSTNGDEWGNMVILHNLGRNMPVINDEYGYLGEVRPETTPQIVMNRDQHRRTIWGIAIAGGYGSSGDRHYSEKGWIWVSGEWVDRPGEYGDIKTMADFFTTKGIEYWKMAANNALVKSGKRVYVLAEPGRQYVFYSAAGGDFSIDLAAGNYHAKQFDPATGDEIDLGTVSGGQAKTFSTPPGSDCVIYLLPTSETSARNTCNDLLTTATTVYKSEY